MKAITKVFQMLGMTLALVLSVPPLHAEDIEVYLVEGNETSGANILILIDNAGSTHRNYADGTAPGGTKYFDEIAYAMQVVLNNTSGGARMGIAAQHAGGTAGGFMHYPVEQITEVQKPSDLEFFPIGGVAEAGQSQVSGFPQAMDIADATVTLPYDPAFGATAGDNARLGVIFGQVGVPRFAKIVSATLEMGSDETDNNGVKLLMGYEINDAPAAFSATDTLYNRTYSTGAPVAVAGDLDGNALTVDVTDVVQAAVNDLGWCGKNDMSLVILETDSKKTNLQIQTSRDPSQNVPTKLTIRWDSSDSTLVPLGEKSCMGGIIYTPEDGTDDATELATGGYLVSDAAELEMYNKTAGAKKSRGDYIGGIRFNNVGFEAVEDGTDIESATLAMTVTGVSGGQLKIESMPGNTPPFAADGDISSRATGSSATLAVTAGQRVSYDATAMVKEILSSASGWTAGGAIGFKLSYGGGTSVNVHALENGAGSSASLSLKVLAATPGEFAGSFSRRDEIRAVIAAMAASNGGGNAKPHETFVEGARYMLGLDDVFDAGSGAIAAFKGEDRSNPYLSPNEKFFANGECGGNHIIVVNHSEANQEKNGPSVSAVKGSSCSASATVALKDDSGKLVQAGGESVMVPVNEQWTCTGELAAFLTDAEKNGLGVPVQTHAVAFAPSKDETTYGMQYVAEQGDGIFKASTNADELAEAILQILDTITISNASLAAPGVAVNQLNRFRHLDQLFYGVFAPAVTTRWEGNLKRYRLAPGPQIVDENGNPAVDLDSGFFKEDSDSWWGSTADGPTVIAGGAREELAGRQLFVAATSPTPGSATATAKTSGQSVLPYTVATDFGTIDETRFGFTAAERDDFETALENILLTGWGDPLHSEPRLANFGFLGSSLEAAAANPDLQKNLVFVATNDGVIHAINPIDGSEHWAFTPAEEALKLKNRFDNPKLVDQKRSTYGMDGSMTFWRRGDGSTGIEHMLLYAGQRRGGRNYYGLNVSDAYNKGAPGVMWVIQGGSSGFKKLGQTWSAPILAQVMVNGVKTPVLIFTGGYDTSTHDVEGAISTSGDSLGNALYIVNAWSGGLIWSASNDLSDGAKVANSDMKWSIPASPAVVDLDFDGLVDHIYMADTAGQVFRVDINNANTTADDLAFRVKTFAQLGITESNTDTDSVINNRKFFAQPVVGSNDRGNGYILQIGLGSGNRVYPTNFDTDDRIFLLDDAEAINALTATLVSPAAPLTSNDLLDVTSEADSGNFDASTHKGWYVDLLDNGEKSVSSGAIVDGKLIMTAYLPDTAITDCTRVIGLSRLYTFDVLDGSGPPDTPRSKDVQLPGLSPNVNVTVNANENGTSDLTVIVGTQVEYGGEADAGRLSRTRWYEVENKAQADKVINDAKGVTTP